MAWPSTPWACQARTWSRNGSTRDCSCTGRCSGGAASIAASAAGGAATGLKGNRHIKYEKPAALANLHLTLLERIGIRLDSFMDSTGKVENLFDRLDVA